MKALSLTEDQLDQLDDFLNSEDAPEECLNLEAMDGFFCCLAVGPVNYNEADVDALIWGSVADKAKVPESILHMVQAHRAYVTEVLNGADAEEEYAPVLWEVEPEPEEKSTESDLGEDWAIGFGLGMQLQGEPWEKAIEVSAEFQSLIVPLMLLELGEHPEDPEMVVTHGARSELVDIIPSVVLGIKEYFQQQ